MRYIWAIVASIGILIVFTVIKVFYSTMIDNYKKEHINELSKEVYVALGVSEIIPLIIAIILIRIVWKKITYKVKLKTNSNLKSNSLESKDTVNNSNPSLVKAVYNHTKDIASEIKPTINEYKEKHQTSKTNTSNISPIDEDEIYEKVMLEIEEDNKVKSTWARALAQSEGNRDKAEAMYINFRVKDFRNQVQILSNKINNEIIEPVLDKNENQYKKFGEEEKAKVLNEKNNNFIEKQNYETIENKLKENYGNFDEIELLLIKEKYNHLLIFEKSRLEYLKDYNSAKNLNNAVINKNLELAYLELKNLDNFEYTIMNKLEEYGFIMLSKIIVRKAGTWEDYKYIVENNLIKIFDSNNTIKQEIKL